MDCGELWRRTLVFRIAGIENDVIFEFVFARQLFQKPEDALGLRILSEVSYRVAEREADV